MEKVFEKDGLFYIAEKENTDIVRKNDDLVYIYTCPKCNGEGWIRPFLQIQGGICFDCYGKGKVTKKIKCFKTENGAKKHIELMQKKSIEKENKIKADIINRLENFGIKKLYVVSPETDTYSIKNELLKNGCIFSGKFYFKENKIGLENLELVELDVTDYIKENITRFYNSYTRFYILQNLSDFVTEKVSPLVKKDYFNTDFSKYSLNKKYSFDIKKILFKKTFDGFYGLSFLYILVDNNNSKLMYSTQRKLENEDLLGNIQATIKEKKDDLLVVTRIKK